MNETVRDRSPQSLENEIIALTHRLKCLRPALSPSMDGLTPMEAHALVLLFCADEKQCSVKPSDIARHLRVSPSAVSQLFAMADAVGKQVAGTLGFSPRWSAAPACLRTPLGPSDRVMDGILFFGSARVPKVVAPESSAHFCSKFSFLMISCVFIIILNFYFVTAVASDSTDAKYIPSCASA